MLPLLTTPQLLHARRATDKCAQKLPFTSSPSLNVIASSVKVALLSSMLVTLPAIADIEWLPVSSPAFAQAGNIKPTSPNAQMLLKADELIYDNDSEKVTAKGNVQLDYDGYNVVANEVTYNQQTNRVTARGRVEILEPDGNRIYADEIDLTDDFGAGFVNALRVETPDNTRFAAESAERFEGQKTVFHHGVYTACEPCKDNPDKSPVWQVKAEKIILNGVSKTVTYTKATFELFGMPIAYLPYFSHADPSIKRQSGFLIPEVSYKEKLGVSYSQSYFWATGDSHDLTTNVTGYTNQGFLARAEWRHRLDNGIYTLQAAGIHQLNKNDFSTTPDSTETNRGLIATTGDFDINTHWRFGWDIMAQSDSSFAKTYDISGYDSDEVTSYAYLRGLDGRSYFDLSAYHYQVQGTRYLEQDQQAFVRPVLDYNLIKSSETTGGDISLDVNVTSLSRNEQSSNTSGGSQRIFGIDGSSTRASINLGWKKTFIGSSGLMLTPSLSFRGDVTNVDGTTTANSLDQGTTARYMPTAAFELRYPWLVRSGNSSHVIEPIVQLLLRPDLAYTGILPNEDSQSLVFDATTLFSHDKFSGFDRIESGTRANVGVRYSGIFDNGLAVTGTFGQSFHLAGKNPYKQTDLANVGKGSGLETDRSDYVAALGITSQSGFSLLTKGRFDDKDFETQRAEAQLSYSSPNWSLSTKYAYIAAQPEYGFDTDRHEVGVGGSIKLAEHWRAFSSATFDIENSRLVSDSVGVSYNDECFKFSLAFKETRGRYSTDESDKTVSFKVGIRTIGDFEGDVDFDDVTEFDKFPGF